MADDKGSTRKTMAPAARAPEGDPGADPGPDTVVGGVRLDDMSDRDLDELTSALAAERRRRARAPRPPSFGLSAGEQDELDRTGRTVSPFTGERIGDWPENRDSK